MKFPPSAILPFLFLAAPAEDAPDLRPLMPRPEDRTQMWWAEGFPSRVPGAPWIRVIQTGRFAFALDTTTLRIPHLGPVEGLEADWRTAPPAELTLTLAVDGKSYRASAGAPWDRHTGPRLIESGCFFQRADITPVTFTADDGTILKAETRFETSAWSDRLGLRLEARPGLMPITAGDASFGKINGGFGLDGTNRFEIPADPALDPASFTLEFWVLAPLDYQAGKNAPWLLCKNGNETANGNYGIVIQPDGIPVARLNLGGGGPNAFTLQPDSAGHSLKRPGWNHLALSYDGKTLRLHVNGRPAAAREINRPRQPVPGPICFGRRQDNSGDGYPFRGVIDEVRLHDRALSDQEITRRFHRPEVPAPDDRPIGTWSFRQDGQASPSLPRARWSSARLGIRLAMEGAEFQENHDLTAEEMADPGAWRSVFLAIDPATRQPVPGVTPVRVEALDKATGTPVPVAADPVTGWVRINLDNPKPIPPPGGALPSNDALERTKLLLTNPTDREQTVRLLFDKNRQGLRQGIGSSITGISAVIRDAAGLPTGIPVQLSKNWHYNPEAGELADAWFHGITRLRLPPRSSRELELTLAFGHWGGVPAASHAQLSLVGWGGNQLWEQSAIGSWGESICYEPDRIQAGCAVTDVRPLLVTSQDGSKDHNWTNNVGGADFFRFFDPSGQRLPPSAMRSSTIRQGPCLTEVVHEGRLGPGVTHSVTASLGRTGDIVRAVYQIRLDTAARTPFSRLAIFQTGSDSYNTSAPARLALGNSTGLVREWEATPGGDSYHGEPIAAEGRVPWISLHGNHPLARDIRGAWANRGFVIRSWKARLGGKEAGPWIAEHGVERNQGASSIIDIVPPPGVVALEPGDFVEAVIEFLIMPMAAGDYYGPDESLRQALEKDGNTWRMIHHEATGNDRRVTMEQGTLLRTQPDVAIATENGSARFTLEGGPGHVPVTLTGLASPRAQVLIVNDAPMDQSVHGNDFWQTDYDPLTRTWSLTWNLPAGEGKPRAIRFGPP